MDALTVLKWFRRVVRILIPVTFFVIASWPGSYWLAGVMTIVMVFFYLTENIK